MGATTAQGQHLDPAGELDAALIRADAWRVPFDEAHAILRANGSADPESAMRRYIDDGGWYAEEDGCYVATAKARDYIATMFLAGRAANR
jgi:hypothetical protein